MPDPARPERVRWGVLGAARIAREKVIPAMLKAENVEVVAIASRSEAAARAAADALRIPRAHGSYEALLADPGVDAVYVPLPNHLHVDWSIRALQAGKHVLCEKPLGMDAADVRRLMEVAAAHPRFKVMEAFMYRFHPQWVTAKRLVDEGAIGRLVTVHSHFSYVKYDPDNIRNQRRRTAPAGCGTRPRRASTRRPSTASTSTRCRRRRSRAPCSTTPRCRRRSPTRSRTSVEHVGAGRSVPPGDVELEAGAVVRERAAPRSMSRSA
jgi:hypothetical protein